jgi:RpiR family carbohydrate utilization transcriptional regulator
MAIAGAKHAEPSHGSISSLAPASNASPVMEDPEHSQPAVLAHARTSSKPTVVRFCRSMGYDGLSDFKLKLAGSVKAYNIHRSVDADDKTGDVIEGSSTTRWPLSYATEMK